MKFSAQEIWVFFALIISLLEVYLGHPFYGIISALGIISILLTRIIYLMMTILERK
jgi:hypothetical protein